MPANLKHTLIVFLFVLSVPLSGQIRINEILACNVSVNYDDTYNFGSWVEIYNNNPYSVTLSGYYLSDDLAQTRKWTIPYTILASKGYILIWCDKTNTGRHSNFRIDPDGEIIILSNSAVIIDSVSFGKQKMNISYGRSPDGNGSWQYFQTPTPQKSNTGKKARTQAKEPVFSISGGFFSSQQSITLSTTNPGAKIYYTLNGSLPTDKSKLYTTPILAKDSVTVLRARVYGDTVLPSSPITQTYFINRTHSLPVISLVTDSVFLFDDSIGIYVEGVNGITGNCVSYKVNWNQDWTRPCNFEFFDKTKIRRLNQIVDTKVGGACSRMYDQKSLSILADGKYGYDRLNYQFFKTKNNLDNISITLRNSGIDWNYSMMRDGFMQSLIMDQMDLDYLGYQPSVVYINGRYWGILNIRERKDEDYLWSNYHVDPDSVDILEWYMWVNRGTNTNYYNMISYLKTHDIRTSQNYNYICTQMDVNEFMNYFITEIFCGNYDWPENNVKYWRPQRDNAKWRWILYDLDFGFGLWGTSPDMNMMKWATNTGPASGNNDSTSTYLFRTLLKNESFKKEFISRFVVHLGSTFRPERVTAILDSCRDAIASEIPDHMDRWNGLYSYWLTDVSFMYNYGQLRPWYVYQHLRDYFSLGNPTKLVLHSSLPDGTFKINNVLVPDTVYQGEYFKNSPITISSVPPPGYKIKYWNAHYTNITDLYLFSQGSSWKYLDNGVAQAASWKSIGFDDSGWKSGLGEFGYGENDQTTTLLYGPDPYNKYITNYFRKTFTVADTTGMRDVTIDLLVDDGAVVYINGLEMFRANMPTGLINFFTLAPLITENYGVSYTCPINPLVPGTNVITVEVHQFAGNTSDMSFDAALRYKKIGAAPADTIFNTPVIQSTMPYGMEVTAYYEPDTIMRYVSINEICADNKNMLDEHGEKDDWIEVYNPGSDTVDIGGMYLTDSAGNPTLQMIPAGMQQTKIPPKKHIILWADEQSYQGPLHLNFRLNQSGERICLSQKTDSFLNRIDSLYYIIQNEVNSYGRYPDGSSKTYYMYKTPGKTNNRGFVTDTNLSGIFINEICAINVSYPDEFGDYQDWIELYNSTDDTVDIGGIFVTDTLGKPLNQWLPFGDPKTKIPPKGFAVLWADKQPEQGALHLDFKLSSGHEQIGVGYFKDTNWTWIDTISYAAQLPGFSFGRYHDGDTTWIMMSYETPGQKNVKDTTIISLENIDAGHCSAYPNPVRDFVTIISPEQVAAEIKVLDVTGVQVFNTEPFTENTTLDMNAYAPGLYIIQIRTAEGLCIIRVFKE